jgi:hypothetical protein
MRSLVRSHRLPGSPPRDPDRRQRHGKVVAAIQALDELGCAIDQILIVSPARDLGAAVITIQPHHTEALGGQAVEDRLTDSGRLTRYQATFCGCLIRWNKRTRGEI